MTEDDIDARLSAAESRLSRLEGALTRGGPWPLAERFDHAPEAVWGPRETLTHVGEMLGFWLGEAERLIDPAGQPDTFGRLATDQLRLGIIERDRTLPIGELLARIHVGIARWRDRWASLDADKRVQPGHHVTLGELTVTDVAMRFVVGHLEDHLDQLADAIGTGPNAATG
jgi:hypothetical protein